MTSSGRTIMLEEGIIGLQFSMHDGKALPDDDISMVNYACEYFTFSLLLKGQYHLVTSYFEIVHTY